MLARRRDPCGDTDFSALFKRLLLLRAIVIERRRTLKDITLKQYWPIWIVGSTASWRFHWVNRVASCANAWPPTARICSYSSPTGVSERHLRPGVILRKVTNGFHHGWRAKSKPRFDPSVSTAKSQSCVSAPSPIRARRQTAHSQ
jgi:hypothetical protein